MKLTNKEIEEIRDFIIDEIKKAVDEYFEEQIPDDLGDED